MAHDAARRWECRHNNTPPHAAEMMTSLGRTGAKRRFMHEGIRVGVAAEHVHPKHICEKLMQQGLLTKDVHERVIPLAPP